MLPEKEPWAGILDTGGVDEWIWKGGDEKNAFPTISTKLLMEQALVNNLLTDAREYEYSISLAKLNSSFYVKGESIRQIDTSTTDNNRHTSLESNGNTGNLVSSENQSGFKQKLSFHLNSERSILSQQNSPGIQDALIGKYLPELFEIGEFFDSLEFHQDWEFGADLTPRDPVPVGQPVKRLEENARNLAQMLMHFKDNHSQVFEQINERMKQFYAPIRDVDVRLQSTHLQVVIHEEGGFSIPAYRLSDGTLRWLALLAILLNPTPGPVTCIEEPELGLHPDIIPTLADLLRDASTRTQLILTTHSTALVDAFSDEPQAVCVCEKVNGATEIRRLEADRLKVWMEKYSLGQLWSSGEIGGNRW
jgi:predicted ATPase